MTQKLYDRLSKKIGKYTYKFTDKIGSGYSSEVYKGLDVEIGKHVAIKVVNTDNIKSALHNKLLNNEIVTLNKLKNQENILNLLNVIKSKNNTYIITELCQTDLNRILQKKRKLNEIQSITKFIQILNGFQILAQHGIVHRDLKPANILINQNNQIKIADFGFAIDIYELIFTNCNYQAGSFYFMAPQIFKNSSYSHKSDIWSLGIIFYQMLTGENLWRSRDRNQHIKEIYKLNIQETIQKHRFSPLINEFLIHALKKQTNQRMGLQNIFKYKQKMTYYLSPYRNSYVSLKLMNRSSYSSIEKRTNQTLQGKKNQRQTDQQNSIQARKKRMSFFQKQERQKTKQSSHESRKNLAQQKDHYKSFIKQMLKKTCIKHADKN